MGAPTKHGLAGILGLGLAPAALALATGVLNSQSSRNTFIGFFLLTHATFFVFYLSSRLRWQRAAGWYGGREQSKEWGRNPLDTGAIGRWSAVGGGLAAPILLGLSIYFDVSEKEVVGALTGFLSGVFFALFFLWSYLLWKKKNVA